MSQPNSDFELILEFLRDDVGYFNKLQVYLGTFPQGKTADLFRITHTIKGIAMSLGLEAVGSASHVLETQLSVGDIEKIEAAGKRLLVEVSAAREKYLATPAQRASVVSSAQFSLELSGRDGKFSLPSSAVKQVVYRPIWIAVPNTVAILFEGRVLPVSTEHAEPADWVVVLEAGESEQAIAVQDVQCVKVPLVK